MRSGQGNFRSSARPRVNEFLETPQALRAADGVRVRTWAQMQALPSLEWLIEGLMPVGGVSLIVGHPKAGKSTLARVLAAEVLGYGQGEFLGRRALLKGGMERVAYYSPDEHPTMTVEHFRGILPADAVGISFVEAATVDQLAEEVHEGGYRLLIVDTLGRLFAGARFPDGDSYMSWQTHLGRVRSIASETGCHICLLHHARKSGGDRSLSVLGSAAIAGSADTVLAITVSEDDAGGWVRQIESTNRAGVELPRQRLTLAGDGWLTVAPLAANPEADARAEVKAMRRDGVSFGQIAEALGISKAKAFRWAK